MPFYDGLGSFQELISLKLFPSMKFPKELIAGVGKVIFCENPCYGAPVRGSIYTKINIPESRKNLFTYYQQRNVLKDSEAPVFLDL